MKLRVEQLSALGQDDRLEIFRLLVRAGPQGKCVDEIKRRLRMPGSTLSHHLDALTRSRLLRANRSGRFIYYAVDWPQAAGLIRFLTEDCCAEMYARFAEAPDSLGFAAEPAARCCDDQRAPGRVAKRARARAIEAR